MPRGCAALRVAREAVPQQNAELRNQLEFYAPRCVMLEQTPAPDSTPSKLYAAPVLL